MAAAKKSAMALPATTTADVLKKDLRAALAETAAITERLEGMLLWRRTPDDEVATDGDAKKELHGAAVALERLWECHAAAQGLIKTKK